MSGGWRPTVINAEDIAQVERLFALQEKAIAGIREAQGGGGGVSLIQALQVALRLFADPSTPIVPDEPTGLGAVVEDADGSRWIRVWGRGIDGAWLGCPGDDEPDVQRRYADINAARVLSWGVTS